MNASRPVSVFTAVERAAATTKWILFERFSWRKWFTLGFCAFLVHLGGGGGGGTFNPSSFNRDAMDPLRRFAEYASDHMTLVLSIGGAIFCLAFILGILLAWLSSRGEFMFLDGIVKDRPAVEEPWFRFKRLGNSLFLFRLCLGLAHLAVLFVVAAACWVIAKPTLSPLGFDGRPWVALALGLVVVLPITLAVALLSAFLRDFVVPIMYRKGMPTLEALKLFASGVLMPHLGSIVLFYLLKIALWFGAAILITIGTCLTCCIAGLPYISSVVFLPVFVFFRCYGPFLLGQVDGELDPFAESAPQPFAGEGPGEGAGAPPELPPAEPGPQVLEGDVSEAPTALPPPPRAEDV